jgi:glycosyltransferase involved in cell wall biosynthesis
MRILVATDQWESDAIGGSARVAAATARGFAVAGHDVTVVAPKASGRPSVEALDGLELHRSIARGVVPQTVGDTLGIWRWAYGRRQPDVLVAHQATVAVGAARAFPGTPLLVVYHASAPLEQRFRRRRDTFPGRSASIMLDPILVLLERTAVRRASALAVLSEYSRGLLMRRHPGAQDRIVIARGGVDVNRFASADGTQIRAALDVPPGRSLLLTVRRLEPRMGIEELLRTVKVLEDRRTPVMLAIAGAGAFEGRLRALADELGMTGLVRFLGRVPEEELAGLYAAADLFVLPTVAYEGFGMATVEALAAGTPAVGTAVGATPEILEPLDAGLVSPVAEPERLAATIEAVLERTGPALRASCAHYAASRFAWTRVLDDWNEALVRAVDGATASRPAP